jgi:hypothetical protein
MLVQSAKATGLTVIKGGAALSLDLYNITHREGVAFKIFGSSHIEYTEDSFTDLKVSLLIGAYEFHLVSFFVVLEVKLTGIKRSKSIVSIRNILDLMNLKSNHSLVLHVIRFVFGFSLSAVIEDLSFVSES